MQWNKNEDLLFTERQECEARESRDVWNLAALEVIVTPVRSALLKVARFKLLRLRARIT